MTDSSVFCYSRKAKDEGVSSLLMILFLMGVFLAVFMLGLKSVQNTSSTFWIVTGIFGFGGLCILFFDVIPNLRSGSKFEFILYEDKVVCNWPKGISKTYKIITNYDLREKPLPWFKSYLFIVSSSIMYVVIFTNFYQKNPILWPFSLFVALVFCLPAFVSSEKRGVPFKKNYSIKIGEIRYIISTGSSSESSYDYYITTYDELVFEIPTEYGNPTGEIIRCLLKMRPEIKELHHSHLSLEKTT